ncbi:hypothetical protein WMY93_026619 [Mugilogobius chulae]|uniref:Ig-like domain-containing protein n=1 Tax=Mugilogobius chulae TaxID=88201 RepID=A0AAW0N951_9GOBI
MEQNTAQCDQAVPGPVLLWSTQRHGADFSQIMSINVTCELSLFPHGGAEVFSGSAAEGKTLASGEPGPSLLWELSGERVNHSALTPITEEPLSSVRLRSTIILHALDQDMPALVCHSVNALGSDSLVYNVSSSHAQLGLHTLSLLVGSAAGALGMSVLCLPLLLFFSRKSKIGPFQYKKVEEPSDTVIGNQVSSCEGPLNHVDEAVTNPQEEEKDSDTKPIHSSMESVELNQTIEDKPLHTSHESNGDFRSDRRSIEMKELNDTHEQHKILQNNV